MTEILIYDSDKTTDSTACIMHTSQQLSKVEIVSDTFTWIEAINSKRV